MNFAPTYELNGTKATVSAEGCLFVNCADVAEAQSAIAQLPELSEFALSKLASHLCVRILGKVVLGPIPAELWRNWKAMQGEALIWSPLRVITAIQEAELQGQSLSVIRMADNKNIITTSAKLQFAGVTAAEWVGRSSRPYWPDDEFARYVAAMEAHPGELIEIDYRAFRMHPETEDRRFFCQARLFQGTDGDLYRMNYTLMDEPVATV
jgi:hypothetical protein